jgi:hypothetical protein
MLLVLSFLLLLSADFFSLSTISALKRLNDRPIPYNLLDCRDSELRSTPKPLPAFAVFGEFLMNLLLNIPRLLNQDFVINNIRVRRSSVIELGRPQLDPWWKTAPDFPLNSI